MAYIAHIPSPPLSDYIDDLYYVDGSAPYQRLKVLPMPSINLMINFGQAFQVRESDQAEPFLTCTDSWCLGLWSQSYVVDWPGQVHFYGIHFKPSGAYPFLGLPLSELHNQVVSLETIWGQTATEMREQLYTAPTVEDGFALLEGMLLARLNQVRHGLDLVQYAITEIARHNGALSIRQLSNDIGISQNQLGVHFKRVVGIPLKEMARFYRFVHVLNSIDPTQPVNWALIAHQAHFYDQPHFNKDFGAFTGFSPGEYLRLRRRLYDQNPDQPQYIGQLPIP